MVPCTHPCGSRAVLLLVAWVPQLCPRCAPSGSHAEAPAQSGTSSLRGRLCRAQTPAFPATRTPPGKENEKGERHMKPITQTPETNIVEQLATESGTQNPAADVPLS